MSGSLVQGPFLGFSNEKSMRSPMSTALQSLRHVGDQSGLCNIIKLLSIKLTYRAEAEFGVRIEYYLLELLMHLSHSLKQCF